jgi:PAS domain S-box-containing protein
VTERHISREAMREQATLLDNARDAIMVRDLQHRVLYLNKSAERLYGWSLEDARGRPVTDLIYRDSTAFLAAMQTTLDKGEWIGEIEQITRDGKVVTIESHWSLVRNDHGEPKSVLAINTDVTQRKQLEQQYLRAQRLESLGRLAGGIAHDLNNVLTPIMMSIGMLQEDEQDAERLEVLATIEASASRGAKMIKQVLSFARGFEGRRVEVQVCPLIRELVKIAGETFPRNITIEEQVSADLWTIQADPTQLHQVLLNLCLNARDAMPSGGRLTISAENLLLDDQYAAMNVDARVGPYLAIRVEDTGTGIPKDIIDRIFEPFFTTKELGKGTGWGLPTTMAIVKGHRGFIHVDSAVGVGTRFRLYLPARTTPAAPGVPKVEPTLRRGNGETILVVDDEPSILTIAKRTLEAFGYRVMLASSGAEAVALYEPHRADVAVVITDMIMPGMDGAATIQALCRLDPQVRIIATSGVAGRDVTQPGVMHFLRKPYTASTLIAALTKVLQDPIRHGHS